MLTTTAHYSAWSREIAADIAKARASITLTAISCLPPRGKSLTDFGRLWAALAASAAAGCRLRFILPAPQRAHGATLRNGAAAEDYREWTMMAKGGASLAPYYEFEDKIAADVKAKVAETEAAIKAGTLVIEINDNEPKSTF